MIVFKVRELKKGAYGTLLSARLPKALRSRGNLTSVEMRLSRRYPYRGRRHSFLAAGCPAPEGLGAASFKLARASLSLSGGAKLSNTVSGSCRAGG